MDIHHKKQAYYVITEKCVTCCRCICVCPRHCIEINVPCVIDQERCIGCGSCWNVCPMGAVAQRGMQEGLCL